MYADTGLLKHPFVTNLVNFDILTTGLVSSSTGMVYPGVISVVHRGGRVPGVMGGTAHVVG